MTPAGRLGSVTTIVLAESVARVVQLQIGGVSSGGLIVANVADQRLDVGAAGSSEVSKLPPACGDGARAQTAARRCRRHLSCWSAG